MDFESVERVFAESSAGSSNSESEGALGAEFAVFGAESSDFELEGALGAEFAVFGAEGSDFGRGLYSRYEHSLYLCLSPQRQGLYDDVREGGSVS